jgi:hypothetical protein
MNINFNQLPWHDATIQYIYIDRKKPGERDVIKFVIDWPNENRSSNIEFFDCYALTMNLNFGIIATESILMAECFTATEELNLIRQKWSKINVNLEDLKCFRFVTNSTNSLINIYALGCRVE